MRRNSNGISARVLVMAVALTLIIGGIIGGSVAWLTATSDTVTNTFTVGDIDITLSETTGNDYTVVPGKDINKNPIVTVQNGSEACWLFVKVVENNWPTANVTYSIDNNNWKPLGNAYPGVYYREVEAKTADQAFNVLADNKVTVSENLKKGDITSEFTLTFTAYAVQKDGVNDAVTAWGKLPTSTTP